MDRTLQALNGSIRVHDDGVDIRVSSRSESLRYEEIDSIELTEATEKTDGTLDIYMKNKKGVRLKFTIDGNKLFKHAKRYIESNKSNIKKDNANAIIFDSLRNIAPVALVLLSILCFYIEHEIISKSVETSMSSLMQGEFHNPAIDNFLSMTLYALGILFLVGGIGSAYMRFKPQKPISHESYGNMNENIANAPEEIDNNYLSEIQKLAQLKDDGIITQEEFDAKKKQLLGL